jgi:hypothetical protein
LIGNIPIDSDENVEAGAFGGFQQKPILQASKLSEAYRLAVVVSKQQPSSTMRK